MCFKKYFFVIFLITFFQTPSFASNSEEVVFYVLILNSYESHDMEKFYTLLDKFQKIYPNSTHKKSLIRLAVKSLYENKQYKKALFFIEKLDKAEKLKLRLYQAECYLNLKNYDKVISLYGNTYPKDHASKQIIARAYIEITNDKTIDSQKRTQAATKAIEILESQSLDTLPEETLLTLSKLHFKSHQFKKSAKILHHLLKSGLSDKEELLVKLSLIQKNYNYKSAVKTLDEALKLKGRLKDVIAFHKMKILFENKQYNALISSRNDLKKNLNLEDLPLYHCYLGISFLKNNEYSEAEKEFNSYLKNSSGYEELKLFALENLKIISDKKKEFLSKDTLSALAKLYLKPPADKKSSKILREILKKEEPNDFLTDDMSVDFSAALVLKRTKRFQDAEKAFEALLKTGKDQDKIAIYFELAHTYYLQSQYEKAKNSFKAFIEANPNSSLASLAWNFYIESAINLTNSKDNKYAKAQLMHEVKTCLKKNRYLSNLERIELLFLLARTQYELQSFEEAIETINILVKNKNIQKDVLAKCYLVLGYSYKNGHGDNESFVFYIKKATEADPNLLENEKFQTLLESISKNRSSIQASAD